MPNKLNIAFQGTKSGLVIAIDEELAFEQVEAALRQKLTESGAFFEKAEVTVNFGRRALTEKELVTLRTIIQSASAMRIVGVSTSSEETRAAAELLGLRCAAPAAIGEQAARRAEYSARRKLRRLRSQLPGIENEPAEVLRRTLRSGQIYESPASLVVLGDVNAGAEVVSAGDIIVLGTLRGIAHAGATGRAGSIILALRLRATQLRIAGLLARAGEEHAGGRGPEYAFVEKDRIVIDEWTNRVPAAGRAEARTRNLISSEAKNSAGA